MKYYILEIQNINGTYAHLVHTADDRQHAESIYYQVLASAAISNLTKHAAVLLTEDGYELEHKSYTHAEEAVEEGE